MPGVALALRAIRDVNLVEETSLLAPGICAGLALSVACALADRSFRRRWWAPVLVTTLTSFWGIGTATLLNTALDRAPPVHHLATVKAKHLSSGKDTRRLLDLQPWGPAAAVTEASVPREAFDRVEPGQQVEIELHPGALGAAWFVVRIP